MGKIVLLYGFLFLYGVSVAQDRYADSLKAALGRHQEKDTIRADLLLSYAESLVRTDVNTAILYIRQGIALSKELKWSDGSVGGLLFLSDLYDRQNRYDSAVSLALDALQIAEESNNRTMLASVHSVLGEHYRLTGNDSLSAYHSKIYLDEATALNNKKMILNAMVQLCNVYAGMGDRDKEQELAGKALELAIAQNDESNMVRILELKAYREEENKNYQQAVIDYRQVLAVWEKRKNYFGIAWIQASIGNVFCKLKNKDSAAKYVYAALETSRKHHLKKEIVDAYEALYQYHYTFGEYKKALEYRLVYDSLNDEANNMEVAQSAERTRLQYEQQKKDVLAAAEQLKKDVAARKTRNLQYAALAAVILIAAFLFWNNRQKHRAKTKIENAYSALKQAQAQLIQSEKMASLGELTAGIAHEIQNPLNFVNNFSELNKELVAEMREEITKGNYDEVNHLAKDVAANEEKINHHGKRADAIVKGMLQHSRSSSGQKEPTDINVLADEYVRLAYHGLRAKDNSFNATLKTDYDESIGLIQIIPQDIGRVILNLITNAVYAVTEKKKQQTDIYEPVISVSTKKEGNRTEIIVKDNGTGIPQKVLDKVFQPFFTTKPTGQGTGLGLSLSYDIVKAHGGELRVESKEGEGTTFTVLLNSNN